MPDAHLRSYYLSAGHGDFSFSPANCTPAFYVVVCDELSIPHEYTTNGISEATVEVPMKPALLANTKSSNYLLNCLTHMDAVDKVRYRLLCSC
jgi:hypothetical protein